MVAQSGKDVLVKMDLGGEAGFATVAGMRSSKIAFNSQPVNTTHMESAGGWRELLGSGGVKTAQISGSGIFLDDASDALMREKFFEGGNIKLLFCLPDFGTIEGEFQLTALEYSGNYDGELQYNFAFASAGALVFVAEATVAVSG